MKFCNLPDIRRHVTTIRQGILPAWAEVDPGYEVAPVADHFCRPGHDVTRDLRCTVIRHNTRDDDDRKRLERRIIYNLGTLHPNGMNLDFHFG